MNRLSAALALIVGLSVVSAQEKPGAGTFEVASVRPNETVGQVGSISAPSAPRVTFSNIALRTIVLTAFDLKPYQLIDLPVWALSARFDIMATYPEGVDPASSFRPMLQRLLADRFMLKARREQLETAIFRLTLARADKQLGPQMAASDVDCARWFADKRPQLGAGGKSPVTPNGTRVACALTSNRDWISGHAQPFSRLVQALEIPLARPVVDETGLTGVFDFDLAWTPEPVAVIDAGPGTVNSSERGSIFAAVQEQLGLKLEASRIPMDILRVESMARPTPD